jgi:hypothetical protein
MCPNDFVADSRPDSAEKAAATGLHPLGATACYLRLSFSHNEKSK